MLARRPRRAAFTLIEMLLVIAVVLILGAILVPTLASMWSDNRTRGAADLAAGRLSDARGAAISQGRPYRVCASPDGTQIRVCPDESEPSELPSDVPALAEVFKTDRLPNGVLLEPRTVGAEPLAAGPDGWTTLITFLADGTCREPACEFWVREPDVTPLVIRVRGLTGVVTVNQATPAELSGGMP